MASAAVWSAAERGLVAAHVVTTIHYLAVKSAGRAKAKDMVGQLLKVFTVAAVDGAVVQEALGLPCADFEDAVSAAAARVARCDYVLTRDPKGFRGSEVRALTPEAAAPILNRLPRQ